MARIPGIEPNQANLFTKFIYWMTKRKIGRIPEPVKITPRHTGGDRLFGPEDGIESPKSIKGYIRRHV